MFAPIPASPLSTVKLWIYLAVALAFAAVAGYAYTLSLKLDAAQAQLETCKGNTSRLQGSLDEQNKAVAGLNREAEAAIKRAETARREADRQAARHDARVVELRRWQRAAGETECGAAKRILMEVQR